MDGPLPHFVERTRAGGLDMKQVHILGDIPVQNQMPPHDDPCAVRDESLPEVSVDFTNWDEDSLKGLRRALDHRSATLIRLAESGNGRFYKPGTGNPLSEFKVLERVGKDELEPIRRLIENHGGGAVKALRAKIENRLALATSSSNGKVVPQSRGNYVNGGPMMMKRPQCHFGY